MAESAVEQRVRPVYERHPGYAMTILAGGGEIQLHFSAAGSPEETGPVLDRIEADFRSVLGDEVYGRDEETLEGVVGRLLRERGETLALAESCTGGLIAARITEVPGASDYFLGAAVVYANSAKTALAGVSPETLERYGAVSEESARELSTGVRRAFGASIGLSVTGIAGPSGGSPDKPVGTVHLGLAWEAGVEARRILVPGDRALVRRWTSSAALAMLRHHLLGRRGERG